MIRTTDNSPLGVGCVSAGEVPGCPRFLDIHYLSGAEVKPGKQNHEIFSEHLFKSVCAFISVNMSSDVG